MYKIMVRWLNGVDECVDETDDKEDAEYLVGEYSVAFGGAYTKIWFELDERNC